MKIERLVRRTAVGGFIVAGGVMLGQSAAGADEASGTSEKPTPAKKRVLEEKAPASKAATAARARKAVAAPSTTKKPGTTKKPAATTKATTKPTATPTKAAATPVAAPAIAEAAPAAAAPAVEVVAPSEPAGTAQTAVAVDSAPQPPVDGPVDSNDDGLASDVAWVAPQAGGDATTAQEVSSSQPVATGPPLPDEGAAPVSATANPVLVSTVPNAAAAQLTGTSPNGQITITITQPLPGTVFAPGTPVLVTGTVSVGAPIGINVIYVVDLSESTAGPGGVCGDPNGDGVANTILDCEIGGLVTLTNELGSSNNVDISVISYDATANIEDVSPAAGFQTTTGTTTDADGNGVPDVIDVLNTLSSGASEANYDAALAAVNALLDPAELNIVFFLADGPSPLSTGPGSPLQAVADAGGIVLTFAIAGGPGGCSPGSPLVPIAEVTGGFCTAVLNPEQLAAALVDFSLGGIDRVEVEVNGFIDIAALNPLGGFSIVIPPDLLVLGENTIIARAYGADELAGQVAEADTFVIVGDRVGPAGFDVEEFLVADLDDAESDDVELAGILPMTGTGSGRQAATGALSFLLGGLLVGSSRHLRRRRRHQARA